MQIHENISLRPYNTFGMEVNARYFTCFKNLDELGSLIEHFKGYPNLILGGGSNVLFTEDYNGVVFKNEIAGISKVNEDDEYVYIRAGAGENWHQFVLYCVDQDWAGIENMSLIPGNIGATPMQNIGAYGVEIKDVFYQLEAFHLEEKKTVTFTKNECAFGYRESIFKRKFKGQFAILNVTFQLRKKPVFNTSYGAIEKEMDRMGVKELSIKAISNAVINIRSSKMPETSEAGNAGSFFKNPDVTNEHFLQLKKEFPGIVGHAIPNGHIKLFAGWLIEQCGPNENGLSWKGYRRGDAGCHSEQALVLVNHGKATGTEIYELSEDIFQTVKAKFGVQLEREVNII